MGGGGTAAVQYADGCERLIYFGFPFETIWPSERAAVMERALDFLAPCLSVNRHRVWLPLVMRTSGEQPGLCTDVIINGGFESDGGWALNQLAIYNTDEVHSGARSARVGILPDGLGGGDSINSSVMQVVTLTVGSNATLWLWVYPIGEGGDLGDYHYVGLRDQSDVYHALEHWRSDTQTWEQQQHDLSAYAGQVVRLYIGTRNDGDDDTAALYVDDITLEVCP